MPIPASSLALSPTSEATVSALNPDASRAYFASKMSLIHSLVWL